MHQAGGSDFTVQIDPHDLAQLIRDARQFSPELSKALRKRIRTAGESAVEDIRRTLLNAPAKRDVGLRKGLAAGTKVSIRAGMRTSGVSITTTGAKLPDNRKPMVRAYNKPSFRHPDFGDRGSWITQTGRPYFGSVILRHSAQFRAAVEEALRDAAATIMSGVVT